MPGAKAPYSLMCKHFPFSWPLGSPLHWAAFARNTTAMQTLLGLGALTDLAFDPNQISTTPLAQAAYHGDAAIVRFLFERGAHVHAKDQKGRNLLHLMYLGTGWQSQGRKLQHWVRHGSWKNHLQAAYDITSLLVGAGVEMECRPEKFDERTPLLQASDWAYLEAHVTCALLSAGANADATGTKSGRSILHEWASRDSRGLDYPHAYSTVMMTIINSTKNLNLRSAPMMENAWHMVALTSASEEEVRDDLLLLRKRGSSADLNAPNRDGLTPLM